MKKIRLITAFLLVSILAWTGIVPVQAHAMLMRTIPSANASLSSAPPLIELFFSETVAPKLSKIGVMDASGMKVDNGDSKVDPSDGKHLVVSPGTLKDGVYMVVWNVISTADGHQTSGSFPFVVGKVDAAAMSMAGPPPTAPVAPAPIGEMILKGFLFLAATVLMGNTIFDFLAWKPSCGKACIASEENKAYAALTRQMVIGAVAVLAASNLLLLMAQAGSTGSGGFALPWQPEFLILLATRVGILGIVRFALVFVLAGLQLPQENKWNRWAGLGFSLLLLLTFSLESHAAGDPKPLLPVAADWIHMVGVSVWVGGLFSFLGGMWLTRKMDTEIRTKLTSILIPHFSALALSSVGALFLTGIYASFLRVGTLNNLMDTAYGQALTLKLLIASPMLAMGGINFLFTTPSMRRAAVKPGGSSILVNRFSKLLAGEATLGIVILIWVGVFTTLSPARIAAVMSGFNQTVQADDLNVTLTVDPGQPGINTFTATVLSGAMPLTDAQDVSLEFTAASGMVPANKAAMTNQGSGIYRFQGGYLGMPDRWDVKVVVIRSGKFDAYADFKIDLGCKGGSSCMP